MVQTHVRFSEHLGVQGPLEENLLLLTVAEYARDSFLEALRYRLLGIERIKPGDRLDLI